MEFRSIGMVRPVDKMGRVVIPKEMRNHLGMENDKDSFEIYVYNRTIVLRKFEPRCIFCEAVNDCIEMNGIVVCRSCVDKLREIKERPEY